MYYYSSIHSIVTNVQLPRWRNFNIFNNIFTYFREKAKDGSSYYYIVHLTQNTIRSPLPHRVQMLPSTMVFLFPRLSGIYTDSDHNDISFITYLPSDHPGSFSIHDTAPLVDWRSSSHVALMLLNGFLLGICMAKIIDITVSLEDKIPLEGRVKSVSEIDITRIENGLE